MKFNWYTNGQKNIKIKQGQKIPQGFYKGRTFNWEVWNKGLTAETDPRVKLNGQKTKQTRLNNNSYISWNTGLTKQTSQILKNQGLKISQKNKGRKSWNKGVPMSEQAKKKLSDSKKGKPAWNKGKTKFTHPSLMRMSENMMGHQCRVDDWVSAKQKQNQTRKLNKSYSKSNYQQNYYKQLCLKYGEDNVIRQYFDKQRYPFKCDFYIKPQDLFIQLNGTWVHGKKPFDLNDQECLKTLQFWKEKAKTSKYYQFAIYNWTDLDVRKLQTLRKNKLNFLFVYKSLIVKE